MTLLSILLADVAIAKAGAVVGAGLAAVGAGIGKEPGTRLLNLCRAAIAPPGGSGAANPGAQADMNGDSS